MDLQELYNATMTCAQILAAAFLFASRLPLRRPLAGRVAVMSVVFAAWSCILSIIVPMAMPGTGLEWLTILTYACALTVTMLAVRFLFQASIWTALFCCTAGYTMQNLASGTSSLINTLLLSGVDLGPLKQLQMIVPYAIVYWVVYGLLISRIHRNGLDLIEQHVMLPMMAVVILAVIGFDVAIKELWVAGVGKSIIFMCRITHLLLCTLVLAYEYEALYNKRMQQESATLEKMMSDERMQYALSRETIEAINIKCHDIKHMIRDLGEASALPSGVVEEMARQVEVYDSAVHTGNEALDVLLTEKGLACGREHINLSCIADGPALAHMAPSDLYSLVLNALDNAIEAVRQVEDPRRRSISLVIKRRGGMVIVHVENYFADALDIDTDGLPRTTKADSASHGYGIKSMKLIAKRYGGTLHARTQGNVFHLNIMLPASPGK